MNKGDNILKIGREVILKERDALSKLAECLDSSGFTQAVDLIVESKSYLIVAGIGKSGHIGQKIAASFASTGTPSFFLHPTEASHGDLGMLTKGSIVLAISNSGESRELGDVLVYAKQNDIPIIAITSRANSSLSKSSSVTLLLPDVEEACPNGLAPTTSTTNALAMGDALIVSVMKRRNFTREDFGRRHPGGKLGLRLQTVEEWMTKTSTSNPLIRSDASIKEVIFSITEGGYGCTGIVKDSKLIGIVTDGDLRRAMGSDFFSKSIIDIMTPSPFTVSKEMTMGDVIDVFTDRRIANAYVVDKGKPIALIDLKTLLAAGYV